MADFPAPSITVEDDAKVAAESATAPIRPASEHAQFVTHLFERYRQPLVQYLTNLLKRRDDAEDIAQEAYLRMLESQSLERSVSRARAYLFRVATNLAYDRFRHLKTLSKHSSKDPAELPGSAFSPEGILALDQSMDAVEHVISGLKPRCRQVFLLRAAEHLSYEEIAERLRVSKRTVEREMKHALAACQKGLQGHIRS